MRTLTVVPSPKNLIATKEYSYPGPWNKESDGAKKIDGSYPFEELENRPVAMFWLYKNY